MPICRAFCSGATRGQRLAERAHGRARLVFAPAPAPALPLARATRDGACARGAPQPWTAVSAAENAKPPTWIASSPPSSARLTGPPGRFENSNSHVRLGVRLQYMVEYESSTGRLQLRLPPPVLAELRDAAAYRGVTVSEFVRRAIQIEIRGRSTSSIADQIAERVVREIAPLLEGLHEPNGESAAKPFLKDCYDAELHRPGQKCSACGGSFYPRR